MIVFTEELDFSNINFDQTRHLAPKRPLGDFSWDTPVRRLPFIGCDTELFEGVVKGFYQRLTLLRCAQNTRHAPTDAQIESFTNYLVDNQRDNPELYFGHGSWAIPADTAMPSDAAMDFAFMPSYIAVAWLVLVKERYPHIAKNVKGIDRAIRRGLKFIFIKDLRGHGYDSNRELLKGVDYLALGTVFSFIAKNQDRYSRFAEKVRSIESSILGRLATARDWSRTDTYSRQRALHLIRGGDKDDSLVCPPIWHQWQLSQTAWAYNQVLEIAPTLAAQATFSLLKERAIEITQQLREAFLSVKPKHAVFGGRRQVTSDAIEITCSLSFDRSIEEAIEEVGVASWVASLSPEGLIKTQGQSFFSRLSSELNYLFSNAAEFSEEEFNVGITKIVRDKESLETGYKFHISAKG
jgi:hypothetical protein